MTSTIFKKLDVRIKHGPSKEYLSKYGTNQKPDCFASLLLTCAAYMWCLKFGSTWVPNWKRNVTLSIRNRSETTIMLFKHGIKQNASSL